MTTIALKRLERYYRNNGQEAERVARYTLTGQTFKADNKPATEGADVLDIQLKSERATVCKGTDLREYLSRDKASRYGYISADLSTLYLMSRDEYIEFVETFGTVTTESAQNGGATKIRLKIEGRKMKEWLRARA